MEIVEEQNPLKIPCTSLKNDKIAVISNSAGRPKQTNVLKFSPQPKSIVSLLLNKEKSRLKRKEETKNSTEISHDFVESEVIKPPPKKQSKPQIKLNVCEYPLCTYKTTSSSNMIKHKRRHTSEKPYMCDQCIFRTNFINSLTVHKRIHSGERPFICEHCSYRCNSSSNLKKHHMHKHSEIT